MSVTLNEFSIKQLNVVLDIIIDRIDTLSGTIGRVRSFDDSDLKNSILKSADDEIDDLLLWKVQIMNTIDELKIQLS